MSFEKITDHLMGYELEEASALISQLPDSELDYARVCNAEILRINGKITEASNLCTSILDETKDPCVRFVCLVVNMGVTYFLGNSKDGLIMSNNAEETYKLLNKDQKGKTRKWYPLLFNWKGNLANQISGHEEAIGLFFKAIELYKELDQPTRIGNTYHNIATSYIYMGRLDEGYQILQQARDLSYIPPKSMAGFFSPMTFGVYYRLKGDDGNALKCYEEALVKANDLQSDILKITSLSRLTTYHVDLGNLKQAKLYLDECSHIASTISYNKKLNEKSLNFLRAYYLKASSRAKNKIKAQELLESIVYGDVINVGLSISATTVLLSILLDELRNYGEEEVLKEIISLVDRLEESAKHTKSILVKISTIIIRSKLALVEGNITHSMDLLKNAEDIAIENNVVYYLERINTERKSLENDILKWQELINSGASIKERLDKLNYQEYLEEAQNFARSFN